MKFYIVENQKPVGPFEVEHLMARGIKGSDLVWAEGMKDWAPAESIEEIRAALYSNNAAFSGSMPEVPQQPQPAGCPEPPCPPIAPQYTQTPQQPNYSAEIPPKTWLAESILVTLFCCLPFGIVGIVKASNVSSLWQSGRFDEARLASASAKKWTVIGFIVGIAAYIIYIGAIVVAALLENN